MKLIIVDDEMLIRNLIRMKLDTERLDIEVVGEFADGKSALDSIEKLKPDIVLSDICMPVTDGISFSEECLKSFPNIKIIIITGFNEFDYARRCIKAGVFDYLMKPVQTEELNATIEKAYKAIKAETSKQNESIKLKEEIENNLPELRNIFMNRLLLGTESVTEEDSRFDEYNIMINKDEHAILQIGIIAVKEAVLDPALPVQMEKLTSDYYKDEEYVNVVRDSWGRIMVIFNNSDPSLDSKMKSLSDSISEQYNCHLLYALSREHDGWKNIHEAYLSAISELHHKHSDRGERRINSKEYELASKMWSKIAEGIAKGDIEAARREVILLPERIDIDTYDDNKRKSFLTLLDALCENAGNMDSIEKFSRNLIYYHSKEELRWYLELFATRLIMGRSNLSDNEKLVRDIIQYIYSNISDSELNQNSLAANFNISNSHLSRLLKQHAGRTYVDLVSDYRLFTMIELLNSTSLKDRDIGEQIGILDPHYLSIWFKKVTGSSVSGYRKRYKLQDM